MKKICTLIIICLFSLSVTQARNEFSRNIADLPSPAQTLISKDFKAKLSLIKIEKTIGRVAQYEVILDDGTEINFDTKGNWTDIEVRLGKKVPDSIVPREILDYVKKNCKNKKIIGIEKNRKDYEIELEDGSELKFDRAGNFLRYSN